jgi:hypothetical protein
MLNDPQSEALRLSRWVRSDEQSLLFSSWSRFFVPAKIQEGFLASLGMTVPDRIEV